MESSEQTAQLSNNLGNREAISMKNKLKTKGKEKKKVGKDIVQPGLVHKQGGKQNPKQPNRTRPITDFFSPSKSSITSNGRRTPQNYSERPPKTSNPEERKVNKRQPSAEAREETGGKVDRDTFEATMMKDILNLGGDLLQAEEEEQFKQQNVGEIRHQTIPRQKTTVESEEGKEPTTKKEKAHYENENGQFQGIRPIEEENEEESSFNLFKMDALVRMRKHDMNEENNDDPPGHRETAVDEDNDLNEISYEKFNSLSHARRLPTTVPNSKQHLDGNKPNSPRIPIIRPSKKDRERDLPSFRPRNGSLESMDISKYLDELIPFVKYNAIKLSNYLEARQYIENKCAIRPNWLVGTELDKIAGILTGSGALLVKLGPLSLGGEFREIQTEEEAKQHERTEGREDCDKKTPNNDALNKLEKSSNFKGLDSEKEIIKEDIRPTTTEIATNNESTNLPCFGDTINRDLVGRPSMLADDERVEDDIIFLNSIEMQNTKLSRQLKQKELQKQKEQQQKYMGNQPQGTAFNPHYNNNQRIRNNYHLLHHHHHPIYKVPSPHKLPTIDIAIYLDGFISHLKKEKIHFTNEIEALSYFEKCDHRANWLVGFERERIIQVLTGIQIPVAVSNCQRALRDYLQFEYEANHPNSSVSSQIIIIEDEPKPPSSLDLTTEGGYLSIAQFLRNQNATAFELLINFLDDNLPLIAYMKAIIQGELGYFPSKGATQNRVLWFYGLTNSGKTTLSQILTAFLVVCKIAWTSEMYTNATGDRMIPNKAFYFNVLQLEEVFTGGLKGPSDLMNMLEGGVSNRKHKGASGWGADATGCAYHFPAIITSNVTPEEFFKPTKTYTSTSAQAALARIIRVNFAPNLIPNLALNGNSFNVNQSIISKFIWSHIYHSKVAPDLGPREDSWTPFTLPRLIDGYVRGVLSKIHMQQSILLANKQQDNKFHDALLQESTRDHDSDKKKLNLQSSKQITKAPSNLDDKKTSKATVEEDFNLNGEEVNWALNFKPTSKKTHQRGIKIDQESGSALTGAPSSSSLLSETSKMPQNHHIKLLLALFLKKYNNSSTNLPTIINSTDLYTEYLSWLRENSNISIQEMPSQTAFGKLMRLYEPEVQKIGRNGRLYYSFINLNL